MNIDSIKWILFGSIIGILLILIFAKYILRKAKLSIDDNDINAPNSITCKAKNCGSWFKNKLDDEKYCTFHSKIRKIYVQLEIKDSQFKNEALMYFNFDNRYLSENQRVKIYKKLKKYINKK